MALDPKCGIARRATRAGLWGKLALGADCDYLDPVFTGIVQGVVPVVAKRREAGHTSITLALGSHARDLETGASVAVDGVCLTVVEHDGEHAQFDVIDATAAVTSLGTLLVGSLVNIERSLRAGDEIGGHSVSGHVMGTGVVQPRAAVDGGLSLDVEVEPSLSRYIVPKGFVAVDGCSLTVAAITDTGFTVHLIPETRRRTTLGSKSRGDRVNVEPDPATVAIVETVERVLEQRGLVSR